MRTEGLNHWTNHHISNRFPNSLLFESHPFQPCRPLAELCDVCKTKQINDPIKLLPSLRHQIVKIFLQNQEWVWPWTDIYMKTLLQTYFLCSLIGAAYVIFPHLPCSCFLVSSLRADSSDHSPAIPNGISWGKLVWVICSKMPGISFSLHSSTLLHLFFRSWGMSFSHRPCHHETV